MHLFKSRWGFQHGIMINGDRVIIVTIILLCLGFKIPHAASYVSHCELWVTECDLVKSARLWRNRLRVRVQWRSDDFRAPRELLVWASGQEVTATTSFWRAPGGPLQPRGRPPRSRGLRGPRYATVRVMAAWFRRASSVHLLIDVIWNFVHSLEFRSGSESNRVEGSEPRRIISLYSALLVLQLLLV